MNRFDIVAILEETGIGATETATRHWGDTIGHLDPDLAREALHIHQRANAFLPSASEILDIANDIQARNNPAPTPTRSRAVMPSYTLTGAINEDCPTCEAPAGHTCIAATGLEARIPCVSRLTRKAAAA
ncbi:hypothetical protein [Nocardia sp. NPDC051833]|uniref:hypothetical protein n=1 Tax=Nocardia sp. NPDC051833 TaxID=3155674 RepID=UPI00343D1F57